MFALLYSIFDLLWIAVFVLIIRRGFIDKTFGMPLAAAVVNLSWDFMVSFIYPAPAPQVYFEVLFIVFDAIIIVQALRFWRSEFPALSPELFYASLVLIAITSWALMLAIRFDFKDSLSVYSGFSGNLMGSILFVVMLVQRHDLRGQSFYIALFKWLGTGSASLAFMLYRLPGYEQSLLVPVLCIGMFVFDLLYVVLVYQMCRKQGINPWTRV
jgi:hypothetical protein